MDSSIGGFQAMTSDMLTVLNDIPFSIPPYFALLARAVVTLEGLALQADPDYGLVLEAYPFVARKLLSSDRPELQKAPHQGFGGGGDPARSIDTPRARRIGAAGGALRRRRPRPQGGGDADAARRPRQLGRRSRRAAGGRRFRRPRRGAGRGPHARRRRRVRALAGRGLDPRPPRRRGGRRLRLAAAASPSQ